MEPPCDGAVAGGTRGAGDAEPVASGGQVFFPDVFEVVDRGSALVDRDGWGAGDGEDVEGEIEVCEWVGGKIEGTACGISEGAVPDEEGGEFGAEGAWGEIEEEVGGARGEGDEAPCGVGARGGEVGGLAGAGEDGVAEGDVEFACAEGGVEGDGGGFGPAWEF